MNIAVFTDTYVPQINGVAEVIRNLKRGLEDLGHTVWIVAPRVGGYTDHDPRIVRLPGLKFPGLPEHRISLPAFHKVNPAWLRRNRIDLIHSHSWGPVGFMALLLARQTGLPHVHHYQTFYEDYVHYVKFPPRFSRWSVRKLSAWMCNRTDLVTVPTYPFKTLLESYGVTRDIRIWQAGIDLAKFARGRSLRKEWGVPKDAFVLLYVGRLAKEKNISFLIELMPHLQPADRDIRLLIVGDGPMRTDLESYARHLGLERRVLFTGYIPPEHISDVYHSADLFVFASLTETQGLVTLEAMASGLPVVAVGAYGIKYMLQDSEGAILLNLNQREFIRHILRLMNPRLHKTLSEKAKAFARNYGYQRANQNLLALFDEVVRTKHVP